MRRRNISSIRYFPRRKRNICSGINALIVAVSFIFLLNPITIVGFAPKCSSGVYRNDGTQPSISSSRYKSQVSPLSELKESFFEKESSESSQLAPEENIEFKESSDSTQVLSELEESESQVSPLSELKEEIIEFKESSDSSQVLSELKESESQVSPLSELKEEIIEFKESSDSSLSELKEDIELKESASDTLSSSLVRDEEKESSSSMPDVLTETGFLNAKRTGITDGIDGTEKEFLKEKRVPVTIRYSQALGLRSFYLTAAKKIKQSNPDVQLEKMILPAPEGESVFEVLVDGKVVIGKGRSKWQSISRNKPANAIVIGMSVFISMEEVNSSITKARKKRRPSSKRNE